MKRWRSSSCSFDQVTQVVFPAPDPRNPIALPRLQAMMAAAEARLGRRPRRRPELVRQRLQALTETITQRQAWWQAQLNRQKELLAQLDTLPAEVARRETEVVTKVVGRTPRFDECLTRVKAMVRVAANTSAWLVEHETGLLVRFDTDGILEITRAHITLRDREALEKLIRMA
jgi:hypothetical protein